MKKSILLLLLSISLLGANAQTKSEFERFRASFPMLPNGYTPNIEQIVSNEPLNRDPWFVATKKPYKITYYPVGIVCEGEKYITFLIFTYERYKDDLYYSFTLVRSDYGGKNKHVYDRERKIAKSDLTYRETFKLKRKKGEYTFTISYASKANDSKGKIKKTGLCN